LACSQNAITGLRNICRNYKPGRGIICLFTGESGSGKTIAAEVIANQFRKDLMRIDLFAVASKFIG